MKTLIVCGTYKHIDQYNISYDVNIYGQTEHHPKCVYIKSIKIVTKIGYTNLHQLCVKAYCDYFGVDDFNIVSIENFFNLNT